jgi:hypothetical protein
VARTPVNDRVQYLFKLRNLMRENGDEIAKLITNEAGKTFEEAKAEMVRAYENIEVACGMPMMMKGEFVEDIATGIDELMIRQPVGVCATIAPFNFPGMIPFWYLPYALAAGNTYIVKPSEKVPMTMQFIMKLIEQVGFPKGVINHGQRRERKPWMAFSNIRPFARSRSSARRMSQNIFMPLPRRMANACRRRAERRIPSSFCPMRIWTWRRRSSPTPPSDARDSAVSPFLSQ